VDNLTHSLVGWTLARAGLGRRARHATATLVLASNAPDADIVVAAVGGGVEYLAAHRGPTHGPIGVVGLGLAVAGLVWAWDRWRGGTDVAADDGPGRSFVRGWGLAVAGIAGHVLMDLPTVYGTRLLSPFSPTWFALDWMPIIDVYLWAALAGALIAGRITGHRRRAAIAGLALLAGDYGARAALHQRALAHGAAFDATGAAVPCATAPTLVAHRGAVDARHAGTTCVAAAALPTFASPFTWRIVRQAAGSYEISDRRVLDLSPPFPATRITTETGPEVGRARTTRAGEVYFDFARFPIARVTARTESATDVRLWDARFIGRPATDDLSRARSGLSLTVTVDRRAEARMNPRAPRRRRQARRLPPGQRLGAPRAE
jgi:membrane-bound metal-dependent hydrolase YbcI (DUF457 family)